MRCSTAGTLGSVAFGGSDVCELLSAATSALSCWDGLAELGLQVSPQSRSGYDFGVYGVSLGKSAYGAGDSPLSWGASPPWVSGRDRTLLSLSTPSGRPTLSRPSLGLLRRTLAALRAGYEFNELGFDYYVFTHCVPLLQVRGLTLVRAVWVGRCSYSGFFHLL